LPATFARLGTADPFPVFRSPLASSTTSTASRATRRDLLPLELSYAIPALDRARRRR
jgi:hypothetical protein